LRSKFSSTTLGHSVIRISRPDDTFSGIIGLEASPEERQPLQQKDKIRKGEKGKAKKKLKTRKVKDVGHFLVQKLKILTCAHARVKLS